MLLARRHSGASHTEGAHATDCDSCQRAVASGGVFAEDNVWSKGLSAFDWDGTLVVALKGELLLSPAATHIRTNV